MCRAHNDTTTTFYRWRSNFGGVDLSDAKRLKEFERENRDLRKMVTELSLDIRLLEGLNSNNGQPDEAAASSGAP